MRLRTPFFFAVAATSVALAASSLAGYAAAQQFEDLPPAPGEAEQAVGEAEAEALLQGPIHEAFARPVGVEPEPGALAPEEPPAPIQEIPPEVKPADAIWVPGYWMWDPVDERFFWVSGVWRVPPPGMRWIPGYWTEAPEGFQWIAGFWAPVEVAQVEYLPPPPESLERGPTSPAPSPQHFWVTGCWIWRDGAYAWRPGYWTEYYEGWVWVPAHYVNTPRGVIFCDGYWDFTLARRGQLFAPVYFRDVVYRRPAITYTPRVVINVSRVLLHLFVNPAHRHYYYGDYYGDRYQNIGYYAWPQYYAQPTRFDPVFAYYRTYYQARGIDYVQRLDRWYTYYERHEDLRPPRTLDAQIQLASRARDNEYAQYSLLGQTLDEVLRDDEQRDQFRRIADDQRQALARAASEARELVQARLNVEAAAEAQADAQVEGDRERRGPVAQLRLPDAPQLAADPNRPAEGERTADTREGAQPERPSLGDRNAPPPRPDEGVEKAVQPDRPDARPGVEPKARPGAEPGNRPDTETPPQRPGAQPEQPDRPDVEDRPQRPDVAPQGEGQPQRPGVAPERPDRPQQPGAAPQGEDQPQQPGAKPQVEGPPQRPGAQGEEGPPSPPKTAPGGKGQPQQPGAAPGREGPPQDRGADELRPRRPGFLPGDEGQPLRPGQQPGVSDPQTPPAARPGGEDRGFPFNAKIQPQFPGARPDESRLPRERGFRPREEDGTQRRDFPFAPFGADRPQPRQAEPGEAGGRPLPGVRPDTFDPRRGRIPGDRPEALPPELPQRRSAAPDLNAPQRRGFGFGPQEGQPQERPDFGRRGAQRRPSIPDRAPEAVRPSPQPQANPSEISPGGPGKAKGKKGDD